MKHLINFSHPLSEIAKNQIAEKVGPFEEIVIKCHFHLGQELGPQIAELERDAIHKLSTFHYVEEFDLIIPPALSAAAFLIAADTLTKIGYRRPYLVWLKQDKGYWVLGGIE